MVVITGICLVVQADVVRYRPLLLVLAAGKAASSLTALGFYLFDDDVFIYLLNFLVDGFLVGAGAVPVVARRPRRRARRALLKAPAGARGRRAADPARVRRGDGPGRRGAAPAAEHERARSREPVGASYLAGLPRARRAARPARAARVRVAPVPMALLAGRASRRARTSCARMDGLAAGAARQPAALPQGPRRPRLRQRPARARGGRLRDALRGRQDGAARPPTAAARPSATSSPPAGGEDCDVVDRRLGRRRRGRRDGPRRGRARRHRARGRALHRRAHAIPTSRSRRSTALYRDGGLTVAEGRPAIPVPGRPGRRRHDGDQLGHLLPRARARCSRLARALGIEWATDLDARVRGGRGDARGEAASTPSGWAATASC